MTDRKQLARCTGQCCTLIPLFSSTKGQLTAVALAQLVEDEKDYTDEVSVDKRLVFDMLIPFEGPWAARGDGGHYEKWWHGPVYTCKHFDGKNCGIYDDRPDLCKRYGVVADVPCMFSDCAMRLEPEPLLDAGSLTKKAD